MFVLFGLNTQVRTLTATAGVCRHCNREAMQRLQQRATRFSLFFIPLFTFRRKYQVNCAYCGSLTEVSRQHKEAMTS